MGSMKACIAVAKQLSFPPDGIILHPRMSSIATSATSPDRAVAFELQRGDSRPHSPDHGCVRGHARRLTSAFEGFIAVPTEPFRRLWLRRSVVSWCPLVPPTRAQFVNSQALSPKGEVTPLQTVFRNNPAFRGCGFAVALVS